MNTLDDRNLDDRNGETARGYDEIAPVMGFREYWYPACLAREIGEKPLAMTIMGDPIAFMRRAGKIYALADECPHRGTRLSLGTCQFPGTKTITCAYHGWTFDVPSGRCVGALTAGPGSGVVNKVTVRTYPVTECQGILWIWMGKQAPVAPEADIPELLRQATVIKVVRRLTYGNWRWHVENPGLGHALMLHRSSMYMRVRNYPGIAKGIEARLEESDCGPWLCEYCNEIQMSAEYPGLGTWPPPGSAWNLLREDMSPQFGIAAKVSMRLPGITRVTHFPINGALYYEWFVQIDPDHYNYFQIACGFPKTALERAWFLWRYHAWGRPAGMIRFNRQDISMVGNSEDFAKRHQGNWNSPTRLYEPDRFQIAWRDYVLRYARDLENGRAAQESRRQAGNVNDRLQAARS
ncbi:MAG TPA: Rieske 2Fe-2S domain-containing protein [Candidatus Binataceae bacterium]|nr:Rieske 2Fe-2S domain-containing protein [Candidatus Binataceae bacterium]